MRKTPVTQTWSSLALALAGCAATHAEGSATAAALDRADEAFARGDVGETLTLLKGSAGQTLRGSLLLGRAHLELGETAEARDAFARAASIDPRSLEAWRLHAEACERERFFDRAIESYRRVLDLKPDDPVALRRLAVLLDDLGRNAEAATALRAAARATPDDLDLLLRIGIVELRRGHDEEAEEAFTLFLGRAGPEAAALQGRGVARARRGVDAAAAERDVEQASDLARDDPSPPYNLGWVRERRGDAAGAERAYREALARSAEHFASLCRLAALLDARGATVDSLETYRRAARATVNPFERDAIEERIQALLRRESDPSAASKPR